MIRVPWSRAGAALAATTLAGSLLAASAGTGLAANTRNVYFGAPLDVCPPSVTTAYPDTGCGGGIDSNGVAQYGVEIFSPTTVTTTTATGKLVGYRLQIGNTSTSTLTHVVVLGGTLAGQTSNPLFPAPTVGPSLPAGFTYDHVYLVSGPQPDCSGTTTTALRCDFGNIAAGTAPTILLIVLRTPTTAGLPDDPWHPQPWNELQLNEGSSSSGSNVDSFYAVGQAYTAAGTGLTVTASSTSDVESFIAPPGGTLLNVDSAVATPTALSATVVGVPATGNGENSRVQVTGTATDTSVCDTDYTCFGVDTQISVTTPVNVVTGGGVPDQFGIVSSDGTSWLVRPLTIDLRWDASEIPGRVHARNLQVFHDGVLVGDFCATVPPLPGQALPCRTDAVQYSDRDLGVTVYSDSNGGWKPGYN